MINLEYVYIIAFLAIILLLRLRRQHSGSKASTARIFRYPAIYILLSLVLVAYTPSVLLLVLVALFIVIGYAVGSVFGAKSSVFTSSDGKIMYKRSTEIFVIWIVAFLARIAIEFAFPINYTLGTASKAIGIFSGVYLWYSIIDILLAFSAGMLLGEALHLYGKYKAEKMTQKIGNFQN